LGTIQLGIHLSKKITGKPAKNTKLEVHMPDPHGGTIILTSAVLVAGKDIELR
jgi:hypothetical protein